MNGCSLLHFHKAGHHHVANHVIHIGHEGGHGDEELLTENADVHIAINFALLSSCLISKGLFLGFEHRDGDLSLAGGAGIVVDHVHIGDDHLGFFLTGQHRTIQRQSCFILKAPKTFAGDRYLPVPDGLMPLFEAIRPAEPVTTEFIVQLTPDAITRRWERLCKATGISCRFYDLRHYNASTMLSLGIPDLYAMQRMGHSTPNMLKSVYQHLQATKQSEVTSLMAAHTESVLHKK